MWSSIKGFVFGGITAKYIRINITIPDKLPSLVAKPRDRVNPMNNNPSMKSHSTTIDEDIELNINLNGPLGELDRNPAVGEPPLTHAFSQRI